MPTIDRRYLRNGCQLQLKRGATQLQNNSLKFLVLNSSAIVMIDVFEGSFAQSRRPRCFMATAVATYAVRGQRRWRRGSSFFRETLADGASSAEPTGRIGDKENGAESVGGVDVYEQRAQVRWDRDGQG